MTITDQSPVLVGVGHVEQRIDDVLESREPIELMMDAIRRAAADTNSSNVLSKVTSIRVIKGVWPYENPARYIASKLALNGVETGITVFGGNGVQSTLSDLCNAILSGEHEMALIVGAECGRTQARARKQQINLNWQSIPGKPDWQLQSTIGVRNDVEAARGIGSAIVMFPLIDNALRYERNESIPAHAERISELWSRFSAVAAQNPHAWLREQKSAKEIRTPGPNNRPISFPYPKLMNANNNVDQGAAFIVCSASTARRLQIPKEKWVFPWAGTDAHDTYGISNRANFLSAPGLRTAAAECLELAELTPAELDHVDLYSCFPAAVQVAVKEIGLDPMRPLTVTGGLTFAGGPLNNYVTHAVVRMVEVLRDQPEAHGLITANGGILTKHAMIVYSCEPPKQPFQYRDVQDKVPTTGNRKAELHPNGPLTVETYSISYKGDRPARGIAACLSEYGTRTWGIINDIEVLQDMTQTEYCGQTARLDADGILDFA